MTDKPDLKKVDIEYRLTVLEEATKALDFAVIKAGIIYRNTEVGSDDNIDAWNMMYLAQVYQSGIESEKEALQKEIHNESSGTDSEAERV